MNENMKYLNDLSLDTKILPQVQMNIPKILQIRLTLNKHENISYFKDIAIPSILLIDENNIPVFCFRCNMDHFTYSSKSENQVRRLENIDTSFLLNKVKHKLKESNQDLKNSMEILDPEEGKEIPEETFPPKKNKTEEKLDIKKPRLIQNFSINPAHLENVR
jgi:hypothetical protein